jgi:hypothetical protein
MGEILEGLLAGLEEFGSKGMEIVTAMSEGVEKFKELGPIAEFIVAAFDKTGAQAAKIKGDFANIQEDVLGIAAAFISQIEPAVDSILKSVHNSIKDFGPALAEAFKEGKAGELLKLSIIVAAEYAGSFIKNYIGSPHLWKGVWDEMKAEFLISFASIESMFIGFGALIETTLDMVVQGFTKHFGIEMAQILSSAGKALAIIDPGGGKLLQLAAGGLMVELGQHSGKGNFGEQFRNNYDLVDDALGAFGPGKLLGQGMSLLGQTGTESIKALQDAMKNANAADAPKLKALINSLQTHTSSVDTSDTDAGGESPGHTGGPSSLTNNPAIRIQSLLPLKKWGLSCPALKFKTPMNSKRLVCSNKFVMH